MDFGLNVFLWVGGIVYVLTCLFVILVVLMQEGKSGGMGQADSVSQAPAGLSETFGAGGAQKGLFRVTSVAMAVFLVLAVVLTLLGNAKEEAGGNLILKETTPAALPEGPVSPAPVGETAPATAPVPAE